MHNFFNNFNLNLLKVVPTPSIFAKDHLIRLKRRRSGPTIDLKAGRRELAEARDVEVEEGG